MDESFTVLIKVTMNKKILLGLVAMGGLILTACSDESNSLVALSDSSVAQVSLTGEEATALKVRLEGAAVSADEAKQRAGNLLSGGQATRSADFENAECEVYWVKYQSRLPQLFSADSKPDSIPLYVVNYNGGGGAIISGDERLPEVLAYSEDGEMTLEKNGSGLDVFIDNLPAFVSYKIDEFEAHYDSLLQVAEEKTGISTMAVPLQRIEHELTDWQVMYKKEPMVNVFWYQYDGYNEKFPPVGSGEEYLPHAYVGCVPIAIAHIMSYHKYPSVIDNYTIDWTSITSSPTINGLSNIYQEQLQNLLYKIKINCRPHYTYEGTGVSMGNGLYFLISNGYTTEGVQRYKKEDVINSINNNRPVCVSGYPDENKDGHAWVVDGADGKQRILTERIYEYIGKNERPADPINPSEWKLISETTSSEKEELIHCNWGWRETRYNGYYYHEAFHLSNGVNYDYDLETIANARPR